MPRMQFEHHPLVKWPRAETPKSDRRKATFQSKFTATLQLIAFELSKLGAINPVLMTTDHQGKNDIGISGLPRDDVNPKTPGVVIEFYALPHGKDGQREHMLFACDTYSKWQHNVRAIALTLKMLRDIDRHGATSAGEQYAGFKALPGPGQTMTVEAAANAIAAMPGHSATPRQIIESPMKFDEAYKAARKKVHPDAIGNDVQWLQLRSAEAVLRAHHDI